MRALIRNGAALALMGASALAQAGLLGSSQDVYIVQFQPAALAGQSVTEATAAVLELVGAGAPFFEYDTVISGFSAALSPAQARLLAGLPLIATVERDRIVRSGASQADPVWGLDRVDELDLPLDGAFSYPDSAGAGVHVYIIDTGINPDHQEFSGRVGNGRNFINDGPAGLGGLLPIDLLGLLGGGEVDPEAWQDCNGHGTHVAGTAAGTRFGLAKQATVHAVRVLNCGGSGSGSGVIAGMEWVAENAQFPAVVNMSLGGGASQAEDNAIASLYARNILPVVAAGNDNADACGTSPARAPEAMTVASSDSNDAESSFSNHGSCVDIYAPGGSITSADYSSNNGSTTMSGTSMASPHVAGAAALLLGDSPSLSAGDLTAALLGNATPGTIVPSPASAGTPNLLLNAYPQGAKP